MRRSTSSAPTSPSASTWSRIEPENGSWNGFYAEALTKEGRVLMALGRLEEAQDRHQPALALRQRALDVVERTRWPGGPRRESPRARPVEACKDRDEAAQSAWRRAAELLETALRTSDFVMHRLRFARTLLELATPSERVRWSSAYCASGATNPSCWRSATVAVSPSESAAVSSARPIAAPRSRAAAGLAALQALVAAPVAHHDRAAGVAARRVLGVEERDLAVLAGAGRRHRDRARRRRRLGNAPPDGVSASGGRSRRITPTWRCSSVDRNFDASQRKM